MKNVDTLMDKIHQSERLPLRTAVTLRHLRCFVTVAETGSFTRAAARLFLTQSTLTTAIQQLEGDIGVKLFDRTTRSVSTTPAAARFVEQASRLLQEFDSTISDMRSVADRAEGHLRLAAAPSVLNWLVIPSLTHFHAAYPKVSVSLRDAGSQSVDLRVLAGDVDFGITSDPVDHAELDHLPMFRDIYGVVCSSDHPLARRRGQLRWDQLARYRVGLVNLAVDTRLGAFQRDKLSTLREYGPQEEISSSSSLGAMLAMGQRYSVVPALTAKTHQLDQFIFRELHPMVYRNVSFVTRKLRSLSSSAQKLQDALVLRLQSIELPAGIELLGRIARSKTARK